MRMSEEVKRCFICNVIPGGPYGDFEMVTVKNVRHDTRDCCADCYQEYATECPRCMTLYVPNWGIDTYIKICRRCEEPSTSILAEAKRLFNLALRERPIVNSNRMRTKKSGKDSTLTPRQWVFMLEHFNHKCAYCLTEPYEELDHFVPVSHGGGTWQFNCVPACKKCNRAKWDSDPDDCTSIPQESIERVNLDLYDQWQLSLNRKKLCEKMTTFHEVSKFIDILIKYA